MMLQGLTFSDGSADLLKVGVLYGNPETTSGGNALKFYASIRLDIRSKEKIEQGGEIIGNKVKVKVVKNKVRILHHCSAANRRKSEHLLTSGLLWGFLDKAMVVGKRSALGCFKK
jgi:hypothetical protein